MVAPEISQGGNFSYDEKGEFYSTTKIYGYIKNDDIEEGYKFWLGLLNSRLFWFFIQQTGYVLRGGYYTFKTNYIYPFPVPAEIPAEDKIAIENLVSEVLKEKKNLTQNGTIKQERSIDNLVYKLYGLSDSEIAFMEDLMNT